MNRSLYVQLFSQRTRKEFLFFGADDLTEFRSDASCRNDSNASRATLSMRKVNVLLTSRTRVAQNSSSHFATLQPSFGHQLQELLQKDVSQFSKLYFVLSTL